VHVGGECRRTDQVRKHHRDLATLGSVLGLRLGQGRLWRYRNGTRKFRNRCQHLSPMPERDAKLLEILIGQMTEDGGIDVALAKTLGVLGHTEFLEPVLNLLHRGPPSRIYRGMTEVLDQGHSIVRRCTKQAKQAVLTLNWRRMMRLVARTASCPGWVIQRPSTRLEVLS